MKSDATRLKAALHLRHAPVSVTFCDVIEQLGKIVEANRQLESFHRGRLAAAAT